MMRMKERRGPPCEAPHELGSPFCPLGGLRECYVPPDGLFSWLSHSCGGRASSEAVLTPCRKSGRVRGGARSLANRFTNETRGWLESGAFAWSANFTARCVLSPRPCFPFVPRLSFGRVWIRAWAPTRKTTEMKGGPGLRRQHHLVNVWVPRPSSSCDE